MAAVSFPRGIQFHHILSTQDGIYCSAVVATEDRKSQAGMHTGTVYSI